jgi:ATP-binding cassette, subfamily B, bacterial PglK
LRNISKYIADVWFLLGVDRSRLWPIVFVFFLSSSLDLIGLGLIGGYITLLTQPDLMESLPSWIHNLIDAIVGENAVEAVGILLVGIFALKTVVAVSVHRIILRFSLGQMARLRVRATEAIQRMSYVEFLRRNSSEYVQAVISYTGQFNGSLTSMLRLTSDSIVALVILIFLSTLEPVVVLLLMIFGAVLVIVFDKAVRYRLNEYGQKSNQGDQLAIKGIQEAARGMKEMRILGREKIFSNQVKQGSEQLAAAQLFIQLVGIVPRFLVEFFIVSFIVLFSILALRQGQSIDSMYPLIGMFGVAAIRMGPIVSQGIQGLAVLRRSRPAIVSLRKEFESFLQVTPQNSVAASLIDEKFETLSLERVGFAYEGAKEFVFSSVSLRIGRGDRIGLMGASGSGKTTFVDVILGLLPHQEGQILVNGRGIKDCLDSWRSKIAYLPQETFLLDQTLAHNIALKHNFEEIDLARLASALEKSKLDMMLKTLPSGLDTVLGEGGVRLSGGQRQRVSLARAFYHGREVLIMDEATSALDLETEYAIAEELQNLSRDMTIIVISHRPETLKFCDIVYQLADDGIFPVTSDKLQ